MEKKIMIDGMACAHCSGRVEKALNALPGVTARVVLTEKCAYVQGDLPADEVLIQTVTHAGYTVTGIA